MTNLFGKDSGWINRTLEIPIHKRKRNNKLVKLYYGNILSSIYKYIEVNILDIKEIYPSTNGYYKLKVIWNDPSKYEINEFNKIIFE